MTAFGSGPRLEPETIGVHQVPTSLGQSLGAAAGDAIEHMPTVSLAHIGELSAAQGQIPDFGGMVPPEVADLFAKQPETPIGEAKQRVKQAGLEQTLHLPQSPTIKTPALEIMLDRARAQRERQATMSRGPQGFAAGALSVGTSFLVSALDPLNIASAFIPIMGEARYAKLLGDAGTSALARGSVRTAVGAGQGAVGMAAIEPIEAFARTQEGQDYAMADALRSVMFGSALGGALHGGGGAIADIYRSRRGTPLYPFAPGEPRFDPEKDLFRVTPGSGRGAAPAAAPEVTDGRIKDTFLNPLAEEPKPERQQSLLEFLASRGGLRNDDPLIADVRSSLGQSNRLIGSHGNLIRNPEQVSSGAARGGAHAPMTLDQAREAAVEAGYLVDHGTEAGGVGTTTIRTLLDAMDGELRGQKLYPKGGEPVRDAASIERVSEEEAFRREGASGELANALGEAGVKPGDVSDATRARAIDLMVKEGHEPLDAYERASLEARPVSPVVEALDDLPPRAKEDLLRASIAALHDGEPVRVVQMLDVAAKSDPRIAESIDAAGPRPAVDDADWRSLAESRREIDDPDLLEASQAALKSPEPASVSEKPNERIQAAEAAEAQALAEYKDAEPYLPEELKSRVERDLAALDADLADRAEVIRRGAACLASVAAGAA